MWMTALFTKHSTIFLMTGLVILLILAWVFPTAGLRLGIAFLLLSFLIASLVVLENHKKAYRKGEISRGVFIRNAALEISGAFIIMLLAALLSRSAAEAVTQQIGNELIRVIVGLVVGLLVGLTVGFLAKKTLRRLVEIPPSRSPEPGSPYHAS
jgi:hypothetical protein